VLKNDSQVVRYISFLMFLEDWGSGCIRPSKGSSANYHKIEENTHSGFDSVQFTLKLKIVLPNRRYPRGNINQYNNIAFLSLLPSAEFPRPSVAAVPGNLE